MGGQRHTPVALPAGKTQCPLYRRLGGPQGRSGRVKKSSLLPGFDPRTVQPVASTENCLMRGSWPDIFRMIKRRRTRLAGHVARIRKTRNACTILMGEPEEKKQLGRPNVDGDDIIETEKQGCESVDWINLAQDGDKRRGVLNTGMNFRVTLNGGRGIS